MSDSNPEVTNIYLEPFFAHFDTCCICEKDVQRYYWRMNYGIFMYEDLPVPPEYEGSEGGGFAACKDCYDKYENRTLKMWKLEDLEYSIKRGKELYPVAT